LRVQTLVDFRVHSAHEKAGDGEDAVNRLPRLYAIFQSRDVGLDYPGMRLDREQQSDVHVDAFTYETPDRDGAFHRSRNFDHHVGTVYGSPEAARLFAAGTGAVPNARPNVDGLLSAV